MVVKLSYLMTTELKGNKSPEEVSRFLNTEWEKDVERYLSLGFHKKLGLSPEGYITSLPKFTPQPEVFKGRFNTPILVETRIAPVILTRLIDITYPLGIKAVDWEGDPKGYKTPKNPYTTWIQDGTINLRVPVAEVRKNLADDERGATELDGIALFIKDPEILKHHSIDLPGTDFPPNFGAYLSLDCGTPGLCLSYLTRPNDNWGSATCGRE